MKRILIGAAAIVALVGTPVLAADMPVKAPPPAVVPAYSWTGCYLGGNAGYGFGHDEITLAPVTPDFADSFSNNAFALPPSLHTTGIIGGAQIGCNYQFTRSWLVGLETDFQGSHIKDSWTGDIGSTAVPIPNGVEVFPPETTSVSHQVTWLGTVRGRIGWLPVDRLLLYATGGLAYGRVQESASIDIPSRRLPTRLVIPELLFAGSDSTTKVGWTIGGGLEWALWSNWSVKTEYLYYDLGNGTVLLSEVPLGGPPPLFHVSPNPISATFQNRGGIVRVGLNYQFH